MSLVASRRRLALLALLALAPVAARAQGAEAGVVRLTARHALLGSALVGPAVGGRFRRDDARVAFRVGVERLGGHGDRIASPCSGLLQPGTCAPEPLRDESLLVAATGKCSTCWFAPNEA
jgi:hypothetical protein